MSKLQPKNGWYFRWLAVNAEKLPVCFIANFHYGRLQGSLLNKVIILPIAFFVECILPVAVVS
jgi:predicted DNA repair protein MutK